jgi:hypothetical protein
MRVHLRGQLCGSFLSTRSLPGYTWKACIRTHLLDSSLHVYVQGARHRDPYENHDRECPEIRVRNVMLRAKHLSMFIVLSPKSSTTFDRVMQSHGDV